MKRMLASSAAAVSLTLFCAVAAVWLYSAMEHRLSVARTFHGIAVFPDDNRILDQEDGGPPLLEANLPALRNISRTRFALVGFEYMAGGAPNAGVVGIPLFWVVVIPYWSLLLLTGAGPAWCLYRRRRCKHRLRHGLCPYCGYDLRGIGDRCPECGNVPAARVAA